jgi:hypothetical protein
MHGLKQPFGTIWVLCKFFIETRQQVVILFLAASLVKICWWSTVHVSCSLRVRGVGVQGTVYYISADLFQVKNVMLFLMVIAKMLLCIITVCVNNYFTNLHCI